MTLRSELIATHIKLESLIIEMIELRKKIEKEVENNYNPELEELLKSLDERMAEIRFKGLG